MSDPQQIEKDLRDYLDKEPNLRKEDRIKYLKAIFDKYFVTSNLEHSLTYNDVNNIVSQAKQYYSTRSMPVYISNKIVDVSLFNAISMIESVLSILNHHRLLKKHVKLSYTDASSDYESLE